MISEHLVTTLEPGNYFRDWLIEVLGDKIQNKRCEVKVYKIEGASHTVCRYVFRGERYSVVAKFYAEPTGWKRHYNAAQSMKREFRILKKVVQIIDVPKPIAIREDFDCVLVTQYVRGTSLYSYMTKQKDLYDNLTRVANLLRRLHDHTISEYRKEEEFAKFHKTLDQLKLPPSRREYYNRLLGEWWFGSNLDRQHGCLIHHDANPVNYLFKHNKLYALDFESAREHANPVHDLGIIAAELKNHFEFMERDNDRAERYIGHFLWKYSRDEEEFHRITRALPFFMSLGLLRMVRLGLGNEHRTYIFREAEACLRAEH